MMRKEIKRALLLWPAAASAVVVVASTLSPLWFAARSIDRFAAAQPARALSRLTPRLAEVPLAEGSVSRSLHAASESVARKTLLAPVLDASDELAGCGSAPHWRVVRRWMDPTISSPGEPSVLAPGVDEPSDDFLATAASNVVRWDNPVGRVLLATSPGASIGDEGAGLEIGMGLEPASGGNEIGSPWAGLRRWVPTPVVTSATGSLIPESVALLAKPEPPSIRIRAADPGVWPIPKQLRLDLATLVHRADLANGVDSSKGASGGAAWTLTSAEDRRGDADDSDSDTAIDDDVPPASLTPLPPVSARQRDAAAIIMGRWADSVDAKLSQLGRLPSLADPRAGELIRDLSALAEAGLQLGEKVPDRDQQIRWMRTAHALSRRTSIWGSVWALSNQPTSSSNQPMSSSHDLTLTSRSNDKSLHRSGVDFRGLTDALKAELAETGDAAGWQSFLLLDDIAGIDSMADYADRALLAQRFLSRLTYQGLGTAHLAWLDRPSVKRLADAVQTIATKPIDYVALLADIERQESDSIDLASLNVTDAFQSLRFTDEMARVRVAKAIDLNYRNANLRTAISVQLLDRLLPAVPDQSAPIATRVLGSDVRGHSHTHSELALQLVPSADSWHIEIQSHGVVNTTSRGQQSSVTVRTTGRNDFHARTPVIIGRDGASIGQTRVDISGGNQLQGIDTSVDGWPLLGTLVRSIAKSRYDDARATADAISESKIRDEVTLKLQTELQSQTRAATERLDELVFGPLGKLNLNPRVIDQQTTTDRLIARYRVAGDWQLAAHTPRPRAYSDSWMSVQMHQSALNNLLERILPSGQSKSFEDLFADTVTLFGGDPASLPADVPGDAEIEFAGTRPITIEIEDGRLWLTFRVVSLSQPGSPKLRRFIVRAGYRPQVDGLDAKLVRDGHLRVSGPGMSMRQRLPVRAIFNKILAEDRTLPLTVAKLKEHPATADLVITQLELRDGWIALAIGPPRDSAAESLQDQMQIASRP